MSDESIDRTQDLLAEIASIVPDDEDRQNQLYKLVDGYISSHTEGLKAKNSELLAENKKLKSTVPEELDAETIREMVDELKGRSLEEYRESVERESQEKINAVQEQLAESEARAQQIDRKYQSTLIDIQLRSEAERAGVRAEAIDDFLALHRANFELKDGQAVASGETTAGEYVAAALERAPYWYPQSVGAGAAGSRGSVGSPMDRDGRALEAAAASGDMSEYRKIRQKQMQSRG